VKKNRYVVCPVDNKKKIKANRKIKVKGGVLVPRSKGFTGAVSPVFQSRTAAQRNNFTGERTVGQRGGENVQVENSQKAISPGCPWKEEEAE